MFSTVPSLHTQYINIETLIVEKGLVGWVWWWVMGDWLVGQWIVGDISSQKIFGLCGIKGHIYSCKG